MAQRGWTLTLAITVGAALVAAPVASADSIVYEKGGNVWQAQPDGSDQRQITTDGGYARPTQADDGTIVAVKNQLLVRMDRGGRILNTAGDDDHGGPLVPQLSPGGAHVAYSYNNIGPTTPGLRATFSFAGRETDHDEIFQISGRGNTAWVNNERVVMFDNNSPDQDLLTYRLGDGATQTWFDDASIDMVGGDIQAGSSRFAGTDGAKIHLYTLDGPPPGGAPTHECTLTGPVGSFFRPTWAPTGGGLAWQEDDGIWMGVFNLGGLACPPVVAPRVVIPGGKAPDWGPAEVSTPAAPAGPAGGGAPAGTGTVAPAVSTPAGDVTAPVVRVTLGQRSTKRRVLAGLTIPVRCNEACLITAELIVDRRTARRLRMGRSVRLARATKRLTKAGSTTVRLRPGAKLRSRIRRARLRQVTVRIGATDAAGNRSGLVTRTLRLR